MKSHNLIFQLNTEESMVITLEDPIEYLNPCYEEYIILSENNKFVRLADGPIYYNMQQLVHHINNALNNKSSLHKSITQDIGYLYNEYHNDEDDFVMNTFPNGYSSWVGCEYRIWSGTLNNLYLVTWMYNDNNGNIIFEITPFYPYMYCDPEEEQNYISYDEWIKTYKPYLIRTLSRETAQEWLSQAEFLIKTMDEYVRKWEEKGLV